MNLSERDICKIQDALMSLDPAAVMVAQGLLVSAKDAKADPALIEDARATYGSDEIEIDEDAGTSRGEDAGTWVAAWVWVPDALDEDEEPAELPPIPADFPIQPIENEDAARYAVTCGTCGRTWDDGQQTAYTPAPGGRCPFEAFHAA